MEFIRAIVKKYSREYGRTLKNGKKRKYQTEQVQITIPKEDNIFEDDETVFIIPSKYIKDIERNSEKIRILELKNNELKEENNSLTSTIEKDNNRIYDFKTTMEKLRIENSSLNEKLAKYEGKISQGLKNNEFPEKYNNLEKIGILEKNKELEKDKENLKEKVEFLNSYINDLKHHIETLQYSQKKEILMLEEEYNRLNQQYENKKLALKKAEQSASYHETITKKLKEFILKSY